MYPHLGLPEPYGDAMGASEHPGLGSRIACFSGGLA